MSASTTQNEPASCDHEWVRVFDGWPRWCLKCNVGVKDAFPEPLARDMTKRERFAMAAMQGMNVNRGLTSLDSETIAAWAVQQADALLAALEVR